jgi:hypothetical protein
VEVEVEVEDSAPDVVAVSASVDIASSVPVQAASLSLSDVISASVPDNYQRISKILAEIGCSSKLRVFEENELDDDLLDDMTEEHFALAGLSSDEVIMFRKRLGANAAANASVKIDEEAQMLRDMEAMMAALEQKSSFVSSPAAETSAPKSESSSGMLDSISGGVGKLFSNVSFSLSRTKDSVTNASDSVDSEASAAAPEAEIGFGKKLLSFKMGFGPKDTNTGPPDAAAPPAAAEGEGFGKKMFSGFGFGKK